MNFGFGFVLKSQLNPDLHAENVEMNLENVLEDQAEKKQNVLSKLRNKTNRT